MGRRFKRPKAVGKVVSSANLPDPRPKVTPGFPEFWDRVHDRFRSFFRAVNPLQDVVNRMLQKPALSRLGTVIYFNAAITANSFGAVVALGMNGYGHDATRIARGMYEAAVNSLYLESHPEEVDDFIDFHWVKQKKLHDFFQDSKPEEFAKIPAAEFANLLQQYERVRNRFDNGRGKTRNSWCKKSLRQRAEEVASGGDYQTFYVIASGIHHGEMTGIMSQTENDALTVTTPPSFEGIHMAFVSAHHALIITFTVLNQVSELGMGKELVGAAEEFSCVWRTVESAS